MLIVYIFLSQMLHERLEIIEESFEGAPFNEQLQVRGAPIAIHALPRVTRPQYSTAAPQADLLASVSPPPVQPAEQEQGGSVTLIDSKDDGEEVHAMRCAAGIDMFPYVTAGVDMFPSSLVRSSMRCASSWTICRRRWMTTARRSRCDGSSAWMNSRLGMRGSRRACRGGCR